MIRSENPLHKIAIFSRITDQELEELSRACVVQKYEAGKQIVAEAETTTDVFFINSGRVAIKSFSESGYEVLYTELSEGACFGEFSAIDDKPRAANVVALTDVSVARMKAGNFKKFVGTMPALGLSLSEYLVRLARDLSGRVFELSTLPMRSRLKLEILRLAQASGVKTDRMTIDDAPTHQDLAARISTNREAVSRELAYLMSQNLIQCSRRRIEVRSIEALRHSIEF